MRALLICMLLLAPLGLRAEPTGETAEIVYATPAAREVRELSLAAPDLASLYEYVHNQIDYVPWHGSRSGALTTLQARRGNDVDIASTLIALLRAREVPARYAVGTIRLPVANLKRWLRIPQLDTALEVLRAQGIQQLRLSTDRANIELEHAWVEALLPAEPYRGSTLGSAEAPCTQAEAGQRCQWVSLDASFKQYVLPSAPIDPSPALGFDYNAYYNALRTNDRQRRDRAPLPILEDQISAWLRTSKPGHSLSEVADAGALQELHEGLLPASLPFVVMGETRHYDSVAAHDAAVPSRETRRWAKTLRVGLRLAQGNLTFESKGTPLLLAEISGGRLTLTTEWSTTGSLPNMVLRLDGKEIARPIGGTGSVGGLAPRLGLPFTILLALDGAPGLAAGEPDRNITATYQGAVGGYYLVASGGEASNWTQVHRAADQLLAAATEWPIVMRPNETGCEADGRGCTPYVDANRNGWDVRDLPLLSHKPALDALTGGLLHVAASQYYAELRSRLERSDRLMKTATPIIGFLGVVSSTFEAEYVDDTAFSILPGGLLIDMKGITVGGSWRTHEPNAPWSNRQFEFLGHVVSSLEHETWQALTGHDAVSTVRGIQMALADGADLLNVVRTDRSNTVPAFLAGAGFSATPPSAFTAKALEIFDTRPSTWSHATATGREGFEILKKQPAGVRDLRRPRLVYVNDNWHANLRCFDEAERQLLALRKGSALTAGGACGVTWAGGASIDTALARVKRAFEAFRGTNDSFFDYLDGAQGFRAADFGFRTLPPTAGSLTTDVVKEIRDDLVLRDLKGPWVDYTLPSRQVAGSTWRFDVHIRRQWEAQGTRLVGLAFEIANRSLSAGGGYVDGQDAFTPAGAAARQGKATPAYANDRFTERLTAGAINNDPMRTPHTADPVSTVTGNNFHDETELRIRGRNALDYVFTRSWNSAPASLAQDLGLGRGWTHSYLVRLRSNDFGACPDCPVGQQPANQNGRTGSITLTDERGGEQLWLVDESTQATRAPRGVFDSLLLDTPARAQHTLAYRNGTRYVFEAIGGDLKFRPGVVARIKSIENAFGDRLQLRYDAGGRLIAVQDNLGVRGRSGLVFRWSGDGHLAEVADWSGRTWRYTYDQGGQLVARTNPLGETLRYAYDAVGRLAAITWPLDRDGKPVETRFAYYENGRTFRQVNGLGFGDTLHYDLFARSTRVSDARGAQREYRYDENGGLLAMVEPDGNTLAFEQQPDTLRSAKTDALGYTTRYSYRQDREFFGASDAGGLLTREEDALGGRVDTSHGPLDQVATTTTKRGAVFTTTFGARASGCEQPRRPRETRLDRLGDATRVLLFSQCWNADGTLRWRRDFMDDARYRETRLAYATARPGLDVEALLMADETGAILAESRFEYDTLGRVLTETRTRHASPDPTDVQHLVTRYDYDALDRLVATTTPDGNVLSNRYDANGQLWQQVKRLRRADGGFDERIVFTRTFDAAERVTSETDAAGGITRFAYDPNGNLVSRTDPAGNTQRFEYDELNRETARIDAAGARIETERNARGEVVALRDAEGLVSRFEYDALGRRTAVVTPLGFRTETSWDANGNPTCLVDANAQAGLQPKNRDRCTESRRYDELDRLVEVTDALGGVTRYAWDRLGNRLEVTDPAGKSWRFAYDALGRVVSETDHAGRTRQYFHDEAGNVLREIDRLGRVSRFRHDVMNRLLRAEYEADGGAQQRSYDAEGNLQSASDGSTTVRYTWDALGRLLTRDSGTGLTLRYEYDPVGRLLSKTTSQGSTTRYTWSAANRITSLRNPDYTQVDYQYDGRGRLLARVTATGARAVFEYDADGRLESARHYDAARALVEETTWTRDRLGHLTGRRDSTGVAVFQLDPLYRLASADYPGTANDEFFQYDAAGNRTSWTRGALQPGAGTRYYRYEAGTNRLASIRLGAPAGAVESSFRWDAEGNLLRHTGPGLSRSLTWNARGQLVSLATGSYTENYGYDPEGRRIARSGGPLGERRYAFEGDHLEAEYVGSRAVARYFRGSRLDELVAAWLEDGREVGRPYLFHQDAQRSTLALSLHNGGIAQRLRYTPFGQQQSAEGSSPNRLAYTGREDDGSGLYFYRTRYYDPALGRFLSEDPLGFASGSLNFYTYVGSHPLDAEDPMGLMDLTYSPGPLGPMNPVRSNFREPGYNYRVSDGAGNSWPMGQGTFDRTVKDSHPFSRVVGPAETEEIIQRGIDYTLAHRLFNSPGKLTSYAETAVQSLPGNEWDTKGQLPVADVYVVQGIAEQRDYIGNVVWGQSMSILGLKERDALLGASIQAILFTEAHAEDPRDQYAISSGYRRAEAATGGFLLYPNKPNSNALSRVWSKP